MLRANVNHRPYSGGLAACGHCRGLDARTAAATAAVIAIIGSNEKIICVSTAGGPRQCGGQ